MRRCRGQNLQACCYSCTMKYHLTGRTSFSEMAAVCDAQMSQSKSTSMLLPMHYDTTTYFSEMSVDLFDAQMPRSKSTSMLLLMHYDTTSPRGLLSIRCQLIYLMRRCRGINLQACCHIYTPYDTNSPVGDFFLTDVS